MKIFLQVLYQYDFNKFQSELNQTYIQKRYSKEQARSIDNMLFDLYNLTADERKVIGYVEIM